MRRPRSLRVRYTLRALFVFIALFMLWGGYHTNRSWKERAAEDVLRRHRVSFIYGPKRSGAGFVASVRFGYLKVVQLVWRERFITGVSIDANPSADIVDAILCLPHLESLSLSPALPTNEEQWLYISQRVVEAKDVLPEQAVQRILSTSKLRYLTLSTWILNDDECRAISDHRTLEYLNLFGSNISEDALAGMVTLPKLRHLTISHCPVTGAKLATVPGSSTLAVVECLHAPIGTEFAAFLGRTSSVKTLSVQMDTVDDSFVAALGPHPSLAELSVVSPRITDKSVFAVEQMPSLRYVTFGSGKVSQVPPAFVTEAAKDRLRASRPGIKVQ